MGCQLSGSAGKFSNFFKWLDNRAILYIFIPVADFRWNSWNRDHATKHGVSVEEAEHVVHFATPPYPQHHREGSWVVIGRGNSNRLIRVIYVVDPEGSFYVIHAMPLGGRRRR